MRLLDRVFSHGVPQLVRFSCVLALVALSLVCWSVLQPRPVPVILAMSAGHAIGGSAFACYVLAVILDAVRRPPRADRQAAISSVAPALVDSTKHKDSATPSQTAR